MTTNKVTDSSFDQDVINSAKPVLVDYWAEWCGPCKQIGPALEEISDEMGAKIIISKLNLQRALLFYQPIVAPPVKCFSWMKIVNKY